MGEYVKYKGEEIKIGTLEDMYFVSFEKYSAALQDGLLSKADHNSNPSEYAQPNSGCRFRFPFPDEDGLPFGDIGSFKFDRGLTVNMDISTDPMLRDFFNATKNNFEIEIVRQKLITLSSDDKAKLLLVVRNPDNKEMFRIEDLNIIKRFANEIYRTNISPEENQSKKKFFQAVVDRMLKGYNLRLQLPRVKQQHSKVRKSIKRNRGI